MSRKLRLAAAISAALMTAIATTLGTANQAAADENAVPVYLTTFYNADWAEVGYLDPHCIGVPHPQVRYTLVGSTGVYSSNVLIAMCGPDGLEPLT